ncbi:bifunctional nuclease family protein [Aeromicrobium sp. Leaf350]|uniref:bifunctional nuclease family protein n=1 Tax=Aeromicrobium sp. Leaf350 TaxID=2876565 RepID=UPI001E29B165|nr:bifunctional nuclease family protein [Aeromicrobium sp. Leaf350]
MREVEVVGVRVDMPANQPLVLLREVGGTRVVPIWIGAVEASAIAFALQGTPTARPLTHELMAATVTALGDELERVEIVDVRDGIFFAELHFASGAVVEARPSDGIALALRCEATVLVAEDVLDAAAMVPESEEEEEVERFREFLDDVDPEDFA